jgi:PAS domain S-box-containing protein
MPVAGALVAASIVGWFLLAFVPRDRRESLDRWGREVFLRAELRGQVVEGWIEEALADAETVAGFPSSRRLVAGRPEDTADPVAPGSRLSEILAMYARSEGAERILLLDGSGRVLSRSDGGGEEATGPERAAALRAAGGKALVDLAAEPGGRAPIRVAAPVSPDLPGPPRGAVLVEFDPETTLFAQLRNRPLEFTSSEAILAAREGAGLRFLSSPRAAGAAPPAPTWTPAGWERESFARLLEGRAAGSWVDYRGVATLAAFRSVRGTPWVLVAKVDEDQVLAAHRGRVETLAAAGGTTLVALLAGLLAVAWGLRRAAEAADVRLRARTALLLERAHDPVLVVSPEGEILEVNPRTETLYGRPRAELLGRNAAEFRAPEFRDRLPEDLRSVAEGRRSVYETAVLRPDGSRVPVEVSAREAELDGRRVFLVVVRDVTERTRSEAALRESEATLRRAQEVSRTGSWSLDFATDRGTWSDETCRMFGRPKGEPVTYGSFLACVHPDDRAAVDRAWREARAGAPFDVEHRVVADGVVRWVRERAYVEFDASGRPLRGIGTAQDVTERREAVEALRGSEARLRAITAAASDAIVLVDASGRIRFWNEAAVRIFGRGLEEALGRPAAEVLVAPTWSGRFTRGLAEFLRTGRAPGRGGAIEVRSIRKDGGEFPAEMTVSSLDLGGKRHALALIRDVSERKVSQERLLTLSRAVEQVPVSIVITDTGGVILWVNPHFTSVSGWSPEEAIGRKPSILRSGHHPPEFYRDLWETIAAGRLWKGEMRNRRKDGTLFWESVSISPVTDDGGRVSHYVAVKEDVTSRRLLEDQFRQAQKMEAIGTLAGGVAHDFNNLLTVITGFTELTAAKMGPADPNRPYAEEVLKASRRAADLTRQLLAFSRRQVLQPKEVDLNGIVRGMEKMLGRLLGEDVRVRLDLAPGLRRTVADPGQVEQVILNLCVNARDAMPEGGTLFLSTRNEDVTPDVAAATPGLPEGPHVSLAVRDTGTGMTEDVKARIFEPFFTTKPVGKGTGLGLATVFGIVRQSGGQVYVESAPGAGSTFRILLPCGRPGAGRPEEAARGEPPVEGGTETILLVEDEPAVRDIARTALAGAGYRVLAAPDGEAAIRFCGSHAGEIDLLVTDVILPGRDGRQVAREVRERRASIRVLFISGYADDVLGPRGVLDPGVALLPKPFTPRELCLRVRAALDAPV